MSLFSKKPKSIADFEKEIEKLRQKKKLSARNSERLEEYEKQLSTLKTAAEAEQKKKARQRKVISQILCKHRFWCKIEQNIFKAGAAEAAAALSTK